MAPLYCFVRFMATNLKKGSPNIFIVKTLAPNILLVKMMTPNIFSGQYDDS